MASNHTQKHRFCIIIGAGVCGIIQGCEFLRSKTIPLEEFELLDRNEDYGGVWWRNTYPGAACDVPSHIYCISWALNPCESDSISTCFVSTQYRLPY
jgi:cation diffusion facilitator CzcD-associated flavoprotein CzcO